MDLSMLNLKVGVIRKAERHPDADTLYVEQVDCGEEQPRTVQPPCPALHVADPGHVPAKPKLWPGTCGVMGSRSTAARSSHAQ